MFLELQNWDHSNKQQRFVFFSFAFTKYILPNRQQTIVMVFFLDDDGCTAGRTVKRKDVSLFWWKICFSPFSVFRKEKLHVLAHPSLKLSSIFVFVFVFRSFFVFISFFVFVYWTHPRLRLSSIKVHSRLCLKWSQVIHT